MKHFDVAKLWVWLIAVLLLGAAIIRADDNMLKPEELIARHLEALGPEAARAQVRTRVCQGSATLQVQGGSFGNLTGPAAFATDGEKQLSQILFNATNYPYEEASYDGKKVYASRITPDSYSPLGAFVRTYGQILTEGLFGGTLSTAWALLAVQEKKPRLEYAGVRKVQGRELHRLDYVPRRGADLRIYLYFDPGTFRHVRTEYSLVIRPGMRSGPSATLEAQGAVRRQELIEQFSEFRTVDGLTLPTKWEIRYNAESDTGFGQGGRGIDYRWEVRLDSLVHNQPINAEVFVLPQ